MAQTTIAQFRTVEAYLSGGVCGSLWWPVGQLAGKPVKIGLKGRWGSREWDRTGAETFADCLDSILMAEGGDFSGARFTADTEIVIIRQAFDGPGKYRTHVRSLPIASLPGCADLVNDDAYTGDFLGDAE